jgi:hypothetical protein
MIPLARIQRAVPAALLLIVLTRINGPYWPPVWPDEALFSSPAATLAEKGSFATPVLSGLIPGMERATLWNSPLHMVLLSGLYAIGGGESLETARGLSLILGIIALVVFSMNLDLILTESFLLWMLPLLLVFDLTFSRSANTVRMDILCLIFILGAHYNLLYDAVDPVEKRRNGRYFRAGICAGFAALSHPIAILLAPVFAIYSLPRIRPLIPAIAGAILPLLFWLAYILPNFEIFESQFLSQMGRKGEMFRLWGGDTGGIFVVFFSQYGGTKIVMIAGALVFALAIAAVIGHAYRIRSGLKVDPFFRIAAASAAVGVAVLAASEAWYALHVGPFLLMLAGFLRDPASIDLRSRYSLKESFMLNRLPLILLSLFLILSTVYFTGRNRLFLKSHETIREYETAILSATSGCDLIYLRVRPDPYFLIRSHRPEREILEFIPAKLRLSENINNFHIDNLQKRYDSVDCFLLDENDGWEPYLNGYLNERRDRFTVREWKFSVPVGTVRLFRRAPVSRN